MNIPEGYVLVPVEITQEMIQAGIDTECVDTGDEDFDEKQDYRAVYKSFLESAPQFPEYDEAKERDLFEVEYPLCSGVEWREEKSAYCVYIPGVNGFWACVNSAFQTQRNWSVWNKCAKSRARSAE